jgi:XTP/dITP diphosphohydrolase
VTVRPENIGKGKTLVLASNNAHKLEEVGRVLAPLGFVLRPLKDFPEIPDPPETGSTFESNALQKARFVFERTGLPTLADDSGLEVDALGGAPGVHSKRYTPEAIASTNNAKLLRELDAVQDRCARFVCALALVTPAGESAWRGTVEGQIAQAMKGENGFGYDPLFLPDLAPGRSMAELSGPEKDAISHRGAALRKLQAQIEALRA